MKTSREKRHNEVTAAIWIETTWRESVRQNPFAADAESRKKQNEEASRADAAFWEQMEREWGFSLKSLDKFFEDFGTPQSVRAARNSNQPKPSGTWPGWFEARDMIAIATGAAEPKWMNNSWWHDHTYHALDAVSSVSDMQRIAIPDWPSLPVVRRMIESRDQWHNAHPEEPPSGLGLTYDLTIPGRALAHSINYPSFVDLGTFLMGMTRFLTILGGEPQLADAFMDKCFELSAGYTDFLLSLHPEKIEALCGFGGDTTCMLSPSLYPRYGAAWDARLFDHVRKTHGTPDDLPCNLHSCGPSGHLYGLWGKHPRHGNVTTLQTRLLPGKVRALRENLPDTQLELTISPPHFDAVRAEPAALKDLLRESIRDAGCRDAHFVILMAAHRPDELERVKLNAAACREVMEESKP
ncbi:MAG: hypothetical protein HY360_16460 [Verrucomicrobia bacterium]|nr:hypothetical protein [Verrucomicrobiota bacterium]